MIKKVILKAPIFIAVLLSYLIFFSSAAIAVENSPEAIKIENIKITPQHGVVQGKSVQLHAILEPENIWFDAVEWESSNPNVIECTKSGKIKGVSAGDYAYITCKAKLGNISKKIKVYCVEPIGNYVKSGFVDPFTFIYAQPSAGKISAFHFNIYMILEPFIILRSTPMSYNGYIIDPSLIMDAKCEIRGRYGSYAYIVFLRDDGYIDGFVKYTRLKERDFNGFLKLSSTNMDVWGNGFVNSNKKLTVNYNGNVEWTVSDSNIIDFDEKTGQVVGKKPGVATITATAEGISRICTVHSLYRWPQKDGAISSTRKRDWKTQTNCDTHLYSALGSNYSSFRDLAEGTSFTVYGESGTGDGWAYGCVTGTDYWGYIPINRISTKGTISQYRNMNWLWPVKTASGKSKANYISSPYGWRDTNPYMHKGIDITTGTSGVINGYEVVSAFDGEVIYISTNSSNSTGYCVAVRSNELDPVSGKNFVAFYMHLNKVPSVVLNQVVSKGERLGFVGNTGNSGGYHLHFEANNQNASIGDNKRNYFANLINPLFFYLNPTNNCIIGDSDDKKGNDDKFIIDSGTAAVSKYNGAYWYGDDREENER